MNKEKRIPLQKRAEILIAEDSLTQATQLEHLLESNHYKVYVTQNGKQAMDRLLKHKPSLVISDILMPELNGYELCKKIKSNKNTQDIPVILLTRLTDTEEIIEGLSCGADSFITKPYNEKHLLSNIEKIFSAGNKEDQKKVTFGVQILFKGKKRFIQAEQQNVIKLILDIYEGAIYQNENLVRTQEELRLLNDRLKSLVEDRTADLCEEIKLSNRINENLKESEEKYHRIFENVQDLYYETSIDGTIINVSPSIEILSHGQYHCDDLIGKSMHDFYSDIDERATLLSQIEALGTVSDYEITLKNKNGSLVPCSVSSKICFDPQGRPEKIIGSIRDITERKKAEETIRVLARFPSENPDPVLRVDMNGRLLYANEVSYNLLTWKLEIGKEIPSFIQKIISEVLEKGIGRIIETEHYNKNFSFSIVPILEEGYVNLYFRNITDQKKAEEVLIENESSLQDAQEIAKMGSWEWDMVTQRTKWSDNYFAIYGIKRAEVEPNFELFRSRIHPDDVHILNEKQADVIKNKIPTSFELRLNQTDGMVKWIQNNISPVIEDDKLVKLKGVIIDITERKHAEKALRESEEKFRSIMENSADAIFITDPKGKYIYSNKAVTVLLGYTSDEMRSKTILDITPKNEKEKYLDIFKKTLNEGKIFIEIDLLKKDGNFIATDLNAVLLPEGLVYGSCRDITERKLAKDAMVYALEKAEASDKLKTTFLNNISHEVRTPLNGILGFAEIISQTDLSEEDRTDSLSMLRESSNRLLNTITNYMDISMLSSANISIHKSDFSPKILLRDIFNDYNNLCINKHLELLLEIPGQTDQLIINSDKEILRKILSHLLNNAIKFTEEGKISYGYLIQKENLEFFVKDTGIGISKESIDLVFDRFAKEERGSLKNIEGSGLGLSIAKGLTEEIGGRIRVESNVDIGSCFCFTVPLIKDQEIILCSSSGARHRKHLNGYSILVAEDDETNFFFLKTLLANVTKAIILHASNGKEAIELFKANRNIALILMDMKMPEMDGFEATRQIKSMNLDVPVIALTAFAMSGDEQRVLAAGCDGYLSKPINKKSLFEKIAEYIIL
jgi:PAS domain S-box-containing protein